MEYTPAEIRRQGVQEMALARADDPTRTAGIFRGLKATGADMDGDNLIISTSTLSAPLSIPRQAVMMFGDERITAERYARRVIERDDQLDAVLLPQANGVFPMRYYWIRIVYADKPLDPNSYSKKDDGLFAMRAKSGEKAERLVARHLRDKGGHIYPINSRESPGYFEIRYAGKKKREPNSPDRRCRIDHDRYDSWAEIDADAIVIDTPPVCTAVF